MAPRWLLLTLLVACATPATGRLYPQTHATHVELLGADATQVWTRLLAALEAHDVRIQQQRFADGQGYILCEPFTAHVPGRLNTADYRPGELVIGDEDDTVPMLHVMELYLSSSPTGLVRVWVDANITVPGYRAGAVRTPNIVGHELLNEVVRPLTVVKQWRRDRHRKATASTF